MVRGTGKQEPSNTEKCLHRKLFFGSGAFYIFCSDCHLEWTATKPGPSSSTDAYDRFDYSRGNSCLSGHERLDPWSMEYFNKVKKYLQDHPDVALED